MKVFLVYAHPEKRSFNAALHRLAVEALQEAGHEVIISDLYEMDFEPVASTRDFLQKDLSERARFREEQRRATEQGVLSADILREQERLRWCDLLILQFPLWWFSMPAIMKGWVDRVLTPGFAYGRTQIYNHGGLVGRKALLLLTTGHSQVQYSKRGLNGPIETILFPIHRGILNYVGFEVLPPFITWQPSHMTETQRAEAMRTMQQYLCDVDRLPALQFPKVEEADQDFQLYNDFDWDTAIHPKPEEEA